MTDSSSMRKYPVYPILFMLIVSILTNGLSLSFSGELFAHELDHLHHDHALSADPAKHLELHHGNVARDGADLDAATHICLHSAGQYQPFFFNSFPQIADQIATETLVVFVSAFIPETIPDLPLRPPRSVS